jgi:hypothetical protein
MHISDIWHAVLAPYIGRGVQTVMQNKRNLKEHTETPGCNTVWSNTMERILSHKQLTWLLKKFLVFYVSWKDITLFTSPDRNVKFFSLPDIFWLKFSMDSSYFHLCTTCLYVFYSFIWLLLCLVKGINYEAPHFLRGKCCNGSVKQHTYNSLY